MTPLSTRETVYVMGKVMYVVAANFPDAHQWLIVAPNTIELVFELQAFNSSAS